VSPNVAWSGSLESYHPYLQAKKVSKIPKIEYIHNGLPKTAKSHFGCLGPLGVKSATGVDVCVETMRNVLREAGLGLAEEVSKLALSI
jgi:hypothetical protein